MFTCVSDDFIKPIGVHLTQLLPFVKTLALFHIAWAIFAGLFCRCQTRQPLTTFVPYIPSKIKNTFINIKQVNDKNTFYINIKQTNDKITYYISIKQINWHCKFIYTIPSPLLFMLKYRRNNLMSMLQEQHFNNTNSLLHALLAFTKCLCLQTLTLFPLYYRTFIYFLHTIIIVKFFL